MSPQAILLTGFLRVQIYPLDRENYEAILVDKIVKKTNASPNELLKEILANLRKPDALNDHPWAIQINPTARRNHPDTNMSAGEHLVRMTAGIFRKMMPPNPPRKGKRLDSRWEVFGILAAQYFAPLLRNEPFPTSLREAWESMDDSILFFVYGRVDGLDDIELAKYRFAGNEPEPAANSTLSDWHRKGIEQLAEMVNMEQKRLNTNPKPTPARRKAVKQASIAIGLSILFITAFLGWKAWNLYQHVQAIEKKANTLETYLSPTPDLGKIPEIAGKVHDLRVDLDAVQVEAQPYLWIAPYLDWIPKYGGTISQAEQVLALAQNLATAADEGLTAITPAVKMALSKDQPLEVMELLLQLQSASPQLLNAQIALAQAQEARDRLDVERLAPRIKKIVTERIDPLFESIAGTFPLDDALTMVRIAPTLLGGGKTGPQTYLIFMQNEDELRPTGGFLTAVGSAVVKDGKLLSIDIDTSELVDDFSKPYPIPPWQFEKFMNIEMFLFRDSNWFTDFPTTVEWAEYFYSYSRSVSGDGVIALDMRVIARLLETLGPVRVASVDFPITSTNVQEYLRSAEEFPPKGVKKGEWDRKEFISELAQPLLEKILNARGGTWTKLAPVLLELLDEKHILLQFDDQEATALLEGRNWDGAVRVPQNSDFLMSVDTNMGYNKTNAMLETSFEYNVDLAKPANPTGALIVKQTNLSKVDVPCEPYAGFRLLLPPPSFPGEIPEPYYNMDECHWGYLRIYTPAGTKLTRSNPQEIPAESTWLGETIPARTDDLGDEDIRGAQVFGMMVITPTHETTTTEFEYALPTEVLSQSAENELWTYRLKIQKQPGMVAQPFNLSLRLPAGMQIKNATISFAENDGVWTAQLDLRRDLLIEATFGN